MSEGPLPMPEISIVIPCYNSSKSLPELISRIEETFKSINVDDWELILVNDNSEDEGLTWGVINSLSEKNNKIKGINLLFNTGQWCATLCGLKYTLGDITVILDDDLQNPPEEIPKLITRLSNDPNTYVVFGVVKDKNHSAHKNLGSRFVSGIFSLFHGKPRNISLTSFVAIRKNIVNVILKNTTKRPVIHSLILSTTNRISNVEVRHDKRKHGRSGYTLSRMINATFDIIFYATTMPLKIFSVVGILCFGFSILCSIALFYNYIFNGTKVPGFNTLALLILGFGGLLMVGLGLIGEYVGRIISETSGKPRWAIRDIINISDED